MNTTPQSTDSDPSDNSKPYKNSRSRGPRRNGPRTQSRQADYNRDEVIQLIVEETGDLEMKIELHPLEKLT